MIKRINYKEALPIRQAVLWPSKSLDELILNGDETATHFGYYIKSNLVGVVSVFIHNNDAQFRKFAVKKEFQGQGIGTALLQHVFDTASVDIIWCNARITATSLYKRFGMRILPNSNYKIEDIEYVKMQKGT